MPSWKKIIVSGSQAHLAAVTASTAILVGSNQAITPSPSTTLLSGSFSGSFNGTFTGNGSNLTGITATVVSIPNTDNGLTNSDFIVVSSSIGLSKITYANLLTDLAGTNLVNEGNDSLALNTTLTGLTSVTATSFTGSLSGSVNGNATTATTATQVANSLTSGNGISTLSYNGSSAQSVAIKTGSVLADNVILKWDSGANAFESSSLTDNGTGTISGNSSIQLTGNSSILTGSFSGSFTGDGSNLTGVGASVTNPGDNRVLTSTGTSTGVNGEANLTFDGSTLTVIGATLTSGNASVVGNLFVNGNIQSSTTTTPSIFTQGTNNTSVTIGNASNSTVTIGRNLVVNGDLTTNGTVSFISSSNLLVSDRFALFASGANSTVDGGIIVQNSTGSAGTGSGFALYVEAGANAPRWAVSSSVPFNASSVSVDEYMVTVKPGTSAAPTATPTYGGTDGVGNMYIQTNAEGDIWIYS